MHTILTIEGVESVWADKVFDVGTFKKYILKIKETIIGVKI